ncbi:lasso peptide biosynthesis B2 protein [Roseateles sp.]|uniref:lasso peptide biosynthesis B2 protein n=1 Tax=Roseateles sp. TaxID=1971397 RepID=UPI0039E79CED
MILLDLQRGKYVGVGGTSLPTLSRTIADWPANAAAANVELADGGVTPWISKLQQQGLLVAATSVPMRPAALATARESLSYSDPIPLPGVPWRRFARLAWSTVITRSWLKRHSLAVIAGKIGQLRRLQPAEVASNRPTDLRLAASWYLRMRPLVITSHDKCLHDSLTLVRFLATERLYPQWVVGVRTRPFAAHSWVQSDSLVLNDAHEYVRGFTPILIV